MYSCFRRRKLIIVRNRVLAALIRVRRRNALAFKATVRSLTIRNAGREAVKRPDKQDYYQQADRDMKTTSHPDSE